MGEILQSSVVTKNCVRWSDYTSSNCK